MLLSNVFAVQLAISVLCASFEEKVDEFMKIQESFKIEMSSKTTEAVGAGEEKRDVIGVLRTLWGALAGGKGG